MPVHRIALGLATTLLLAKGAAAMCFEVYRGDNLVYRDVVPPVDLSRPLHQTVPAAFGRGSTLQFFQQTGACPSEDARRSAPVLGNEDVGSRFSRSSGPARDLGPYFRDRDTTGSSSLYR